MVLHDWSVVISEKNVEAVVNSPGDPEANCYSLTCLLGDSKTQSLCSGETQPLAAATAIPTTAPDHVIRCQDYYVCASYFLLHIL